MAKINDSPQSQNPIYKIKENAADVKKWLNYIEIYCCHPDALAMFGPEIVKNLNSMLDNFAELAELMGDKNG